MTRPVTRRCATTVVATLLATGAGVTLAQDDPWGPSWPEGDGRALTGAWCGGCHSLNLVKQQGLTRPGWDELLHWMSAKQNMPPLEGEQRDQVLDYLAASFGVDSGGGSSYDGAGGELPALVPHQGIARAVLPIRDDGGQ